MTRKNGKGGGYLKVSARDLLDGKKALTHSQPIAMDSRFADELAEAEKTLENLDKRRRFGTGGPGIEQEIAEAQEAVDEAQAAYDAHAVEFVFQALGRKRFDELVKEHKPTKEQIEAFKADMKLANLGGGQLPYNTDTLPPALIAATAVEPAFTLEEAQELWDSDRWSDAELAAVLNAAWAVQKLIK